MDFRLSDEQRAVADLAEAVFRDHCSDEQIQAHAAGGAPYDAALWRALAGAGLTAPPDAASGFGMMELALVLEQQGRFLAPVPLWRQAIVAEAVARFAAPDLREELLPKLTGGEVLATLSAEALDAPGLTASRTGDGWRIAGAAQAVPLAAQSVVGLAPVLADGEVRLALLPLQNAAVHRTEGVLTHGEPVADLAVDGLAIPASHLLPPEASADWLLARAACCLAALQLGVSGEALRRTADYAGQRRQFGRPIGSFQGVALRAADGYIDIEALRGATLFLAWRLDQGLDPRAAAPVAKYWQAQCGHRVAHTAMHLHGGLGADVAHPIHRFLLWSRALEITAGGAQAQLARLGAVIADEQAMGAFA
jgi:alkylation response protein AidB-like acyl-CoA dehydrogenase